MEGDRSTDGWSTGGVRSVYVCPPVAPQRDGAQFDRAVDSLESHNQRLERLRALFPSFKKIFLVFCLAGLSWCATYTGMLELIRANTGDIPFVHQITIGFAVATLMLMVLYILDALFSPISWWLCVPDSHLHWLQLRLLLEGAGIPRRHDPLDGSRHRSGAEGARRASPSSAQKKPAIKHSLTLL